MRQGEILNLAWNHVDLENRLAHLKETKNGTARSVPLVDAVVNELNRLSVIRNPAKNLVSVMSSKRKNLPAKNISKVPKIKSDLIEDLRQIN